MTTSPTVDLEVVVDEPELVLERLPAREALHSVQPPTELELEREQDPEVLPDPEPEVLPEPEPALPVEPVAAVVQESPRARHLAPPAPGSGFGVASTSLALLALVILALLVQAGPLSWVEHGRAQRVAYADLRRDLAAGTVPTGQMVDRDENGVGDAFVPVGTALGYVTVSRLGLEREVFFEGTTSTVTEKGPGHLRSTVLPGQPGVAVLYGRAWTYGGPFRKLSSLHTGDAITVTTQQGVSTYRVTGIRHAGDVFRAPAAGAGVLTLVGAEGAPFVPQRAVYVDAALESPALPAPAPALTAANLSAAETPLHGDPGVWPLLFLLMQLVAVAALLVAWASRRYGGAQAWLVGVPVLGLLLVLASQQALRLLPNVL